MVVSCDGVYEDAGVLGDENYSLTKLFKEWADRQK
jgi:hypothetical protein